MSSFINIIEDLRAKSKYRTALRLLQHDKFENDDIGPINEISAVSRFVISIPKCASTAIQRGFERIGHRVIHAHNNPTTYDAFTNGDLLRKEGVGLETLIRARRRLNPEPINIFFGYREPVSWYLSLAGHFNMPLTEDLGANVSRNLRDAYPWNNYRFAASQRVVERASGLKLLSQKFDTHAGYSIIKSDNISIIIYRFDRTKELETYIRKNIDSRFEMREERVNSDPEYIAFRRQFRLSTTMLRGIYSEDIFCHFYNRREREELILRYRDR